MGKTCLREGKEIDLNWDGTSLREYGLDLVNFVQIEDTEEMHLCLHGFVNAFECDIYGRDLGIRFCADIGLEPQKEAEVDGSRKRNVSISK
jgi:hypothetical protein